MVITTPSFSNLPLVFHREYEEGQTPLPMADDLADMEEEKRLMFVAYTRAKKRLYIFKGDREQALSNHTIYQAPDYVALRYTEPKGSLEKYTLSYLAKEGVFKTANKYIDNISKDDSVIVSADSYNNYYIRHNNSWIGRLTSSKDKKTGESKSNIVKQASLFRIYVFGPWKIPKNMIRNMEQTILRVGRMTQKYRDLYI